MASEKELFELVGDFTSEIIESFFLLLLLPFLSFQK